MTFHRFCLWFVQKTDYVSVRKCFVWVQTELTLCVHTPKGAELTHAA